MLNLKNYKLVLLFIFCSVLLIGSYSCSVIVDSHISLQQGLVGTKAPKIILDSLTMLNVKYYSFDKKIHKGQIIVNKTLKRDVVSLFKEAKKMKFPINKVVPIVRYNWDDDSSMNDNNTSSFNYRLVARTNRISNHSFGRAIDLNPFNNPAIHPNGLIEPKNAIYNIDSAGTLSPQNKLVLLMQSLGWQWGGSKSWFNVKGYQDYQHFQKFKITK